MLPIAPVMDATYNNRFVIVTIWPRPFYVFLTTGIPKTRSDDLQQVLILQPNYEEKKTNYETVIQIVLMVGGACS